MATKKKIISFRFLISVICISIISACTSDIQVGHPDQSIDSLTSVKCKKISNYYSNGILKEEGLYCNGKKEGEWKENYPDGDVKWIGKYTKGIRQYQLNSPLWNNKCNLYLEENVSKLQKLKKYPLRIDVENIHPDDLIVSVEEGLINKNNSDQFKFVVQSTTGKNIKLTVYFQNEMRMEKVCEKILPVQ